MSNPRGGISDGSLEAFVHPIAFQETKTPPSRRSLVMKKLSVVGVVLVGIVLAGCPFLIDEDEYGSLQVAFNLSDSKTIQYIDFSQVNTGTVYLKQGGVTKYTKALTINVASKTGQCTITDIRVGDYDVRVELYDSGSKLLYFGDDTVGIDPGENGTEIVTLVKNIATLSISGSWEEEVSGLDHATVQLKQAGVVKYAGNLVLNVAGKTISGGIDGIVPGSYEVYVEIQDSSDTALFAGTQSMTIVVGTNSVEVTLELTTGSVVIQIGGDVTAPQITAGPSEVLTRSEVEITWVTNEDATSNVCYSTVSGFNYQVQTDWAPVGRDLSADATSHSVTISGLADGTYYYVVVSVDGSGNMTVGDERSFVIPSGPTTGLVQLNTDLQSLGLSLRLILIVDYGTTGGYRGMTVTSYALSEAEIVQGDYESVMESNPSSYKMGASYPVETITWYEAVSFCNSISVLCGLQPVYNEITWQPDFTKNGLYLPTEAQWVHAAGGPNHYTWSLSDTFVSSDYTWNTSNPTPVKSHPPNGFGLYDMSGNVSEWLTDWYGGDYPYTGQTDPLGPTSGSALVANGGNFKSDSEGIKSDIHGYAGNPTPGDYRLGFRVAFGGFGKW